MFTESGVVTLEGTAGAIKPYSDEDYEEAKRQGLDLDDWNDYQRYYELGCQRQGTKEDCYSCEYFPACEGR